jgi:hypothetical protein
VGNHWCEPSDGNQYEDHAKCAQSEEASLANGNRRLTKGDGHWQIIQNHRHSEYGHDPTDLHTIIDDKRHNRA